MFWYDKNLKGWNLYSNWHNLDHQVDTTIVGSVMEYTDTINLNN